ncbi:MAG: DUF3298 domain-containing protein [Acidobacteria bacterium]|nr:DUF3298 domain-containing protein [Acidobacteriota bacterium]
MRNRFLLPFAAACVLFSGCSRKDPAAQPPPLTFEARKFEKSLPGCGDTEKRPEPCVTFRVEWPEVVQSSSLEAKSRINAALMAALQPQEAPRGFDAEAAQTIEDYQHLRQEFPASSITYFDRRAAEILLSNSAFLCIEITTEEFHGGAHPNSRREYLNFRPATGERVDLPQLLLPGAQPKLLALAEKRFRAERALEENQNLTEAGFTFENGQFKLSGQWGADTRGLLFFYNPYDVAPYALGPTRLHLPFSELKAILRPDSGFPLPK